MYSVILITVFIFVSYSVKLNKRQDLRRKNQERGKQKFGVRNYMFIDKKNISVVFFSQNIHKKISESRICRLGSPILV